MYLLFLAKADSIQYKLLRQVNVIFTPTSGKVTAMVKTGIKSTELFDKALGQNVSFLRRILFF